MSCFSELTYATHVDGELPAEEARRVEAHLAGCSRCQALVEALRAENRLLAKVLQETQEEPVPVAARPARPLDIFWTGLGVLAAAAGLRAILDWVEELQPPSAVDWLNPFSLTTQLNLFFSSVFYFIREGVAMLVSSITIVSALVFGLLVLAAGVLWLRRRPATVAVLATLALVLGLALPGSALDRRKGNVTIPGGETLDDTLMVFGDTVRIDGTLTGDLVSFGSRAVINGTVQGDVITFAQTLDIDGAVGGNVYSFVQWANIRGQVGGNVYAWAQMVKLDAVGRVDADVITFCNQLGLDGGVGRDTTVFCAMMDVRGNVGRNLTVRAGRITLLDSARVGGDLRAHVKKEKNLHIDPGATIVGQTDTRIQEAKPSRYTKPKFYLWQALRLAAALITGLFLYLLFPALFATRLETGSALLRTLGVGFLALVATPVAAIIAGITLIGLPLAVLGLMTLVTGIYLAKVLVGVFIGRALRRSTAAKPAQFVLDLLVGLVVVFVATNVPYVGWFISLLVILLGLGIEVINVRRRWATSLPA